ncbi:MAG TPA: DUF3365 domain-containing protein [Nitrospira sp.]|nr:DUF3365 domain-containing protein [Nitrospira sp.]
MGTRWVLGILLIASLEMIYGSWSPAITAEADELEETGRLLAVLLDAGRVAIGHNQPLLNDPLRGDKGFTPDVFAQQMLAVFKDRTGHDLTDLARASVPEMAKPLLARLVEESKKTVASYQSVINVAGIKYKGLIPATFGTETSNRFHAWSRVYLKQTAPDHLIRNPKNKPDEFEASIMQKMSDPSFPRGNEQVVTEVDADGKSVRVLLPLFYGKDCLSCHGTPKGERDVTGYPREGAKEGELGGAISVKIPRPSR